MCEKETRAILRRFISNSEQLKIVVNLIGSCLQPNLVNKEIQKAWNPKMWVHQKYIQYLLDFIRSEQGGEEFKTYNSYLEQLQQDLVFARIDKNWAKTKKLSIH